MYMGKIKNKLINLLGGVTIEEHKKWLEYNYIKGKVFAYETTITEMTSDYKRPVDERYDIIYNFVSKSMTDCKWCLHEMRNKK